MRTFSRQTTSTQLTFSTYAYATLISLHDSTASLFLIDVVQEAVCLHLSIPDRLLHAVIFAFSIKLISYTKSLSFQNFLSLMRRPLCLGAFTTPNYKVMNMSHISSTCTTSHLVANAHLSSQWCRPTCVYHGDHLCAREDL